jgi:hypothetical protein
VREYKKDELNIGKSAKKFNSVIIRDGMIVRVNKNGTIRAVLGKYGEYGKKIKA